MTQNKSNNTNFGKFPTCSVRRLSQTCSLIFGLLLAADATHAFERASVDSNGSEGGNGLISDDPKITPDGRFVVFTSDAALAGGDSNGTVSDIYVRDTLQNVTDLVSRSVANVQGDSDCFEPSISDDGNVVAFASNSTNLVPGVTSGEIHVYVKNRSSGAIVVVSRSSAGALGDDRSQKPSISGNGKFVAFISDASNLDGADSGQRDIYVRDIDGNSTERVSVSDSEALANGGSANPAISTDGNLIAFDSSASNFVVQDGNSSRDVFVRNISAQSTELVSVDSAGASAIGNSMNPDISSDGRYVVFDSAADNLSSSDSNSKIDCFLRDRVSGTTLLLSQSSGGVVGDEDSIRPSVSGNGRYVSFLSKSTTLAPGKVSSVTNSVFRRDIAAGTIDLLDPIEGTPNRVSTANDGTAAFDSFAALVADDTNSAIDVYLSDPAPVVAPPELSNSAEIQRKIKKIKKAIKRAKKGGKVAKLKKLKKKLKKLIKQLRGT